MRITELLKLPSNVPDVLWPTYLRWAREDLISKFRNVPTAGFHSKKEARRFEELKLLEKAGEIDNLQTQVKFDLSINGTRIATYTADFVYLENGKQIVEDVKGYPNDRWPMKKKLMKAIHGIEIRET